MKKKPPVVCVEWEDAKVVDGDEGPWIDNKPTKYQPHIFFSVGFLVLDEAAGIQLTQAWNDHQIAPRDQIPRGMIRSITYLAPAKERGK